MTHTPVATFQGMVIQKSWDENNTLIVEGWISTNDLDLQKEITEPEAFTNSLDAYFQRRAPVSSIHDTKPYPIGHLQKGALVRSGQIFKEASHPTDAAEFECFPGVGTGFYARLAVTEESAQVPIRKGNVGSFSFIGIAKKAEPLPGGGRRFHEIDPLIETTIAAYPVNPRAVQTLVKAFGIDTPQEEDHTPMTPEETVSLVQKAVADALAAQHPSPAPEPVQKGFGAEEIAAIMTTMKEHSEAVLKAVDTKVTQALEYDRTGTGRVGTVETPEAARDADPVAYIVKKANSGEALDVQDKELIGSLTLAAILDGLKA